MLVKTLNWISRAKWHKKAYTWGLYLSYTLFAIALTGAVTVDPSYLMYLESTIRYYVCIFLLVRFNPLTHKQARSKATTEFDRKIAFSAGVFLLLTTTIADVAKEYINQATTTLESAVDVASFPHDGS